MARRVCQAVLLAVTGLSGLTNAQSPLTGSFDSVARIGSEAGFFSRLRSQGCGQLEPTNSQSGVRAFGAENGAATILSNLVGPVPRALSGEVVESHVLAMDDNYSFRQIVVSSRFSSIQTFGYVLEPSQSTRRNSLVVLLHGSGTLPQQAFGLRFNGEGGVVSRPDSTPFIGLGLSLARAGFTVVAPILGTRPSFNRGVPWLDVSLRGHIFRNKSGSGGAETLLIAEIEGFVDYAVANGLTRPERIYIIGWNEGAYLAGLTAAMDPRVRGVVRLSLPFDARRYRTTTAGMFRDAAFAHADCRVGDVGQAILLRGKPLLYVTSADDAVERIRAPFRKAAIVDSIRDYYKSLNRSSNFTSALEASSAAAQARVTAWVARLDGANTRAVIPIPRPAVPFSYQFPSADLDLRANTTAAYLATISPCRSLTPVVEKLYAGSSAIRDTILRSLRVRETALGSARIVRRTPVDSSRGYRLSLVQFGKAGHPPWRAVLAEPLSESDLRPAVLSLNGTDNLEDLFAVGPPPRTPYAHGYADALARRGFVVMVPLLPAWAPDGYAALSVAQTGGRSTEWDAIVTEFTEAIDVLVTLHGVDTTRVAAYGISFGGSAAAIMTAIDSRIKGLVYNNIPVDFAETFNRPAGAFTNLWLADACSVLDASLLATAPRPMTWEAGEDPGMQNEGMDIISRMRARYRAFGAETQFTFKRHWAGHETFPDELKIFGR